MQFDLTDLRLLVNVMEAGSITHGAERSNISLAAASERLRGLEQAFGVALLRRRSRGVESTPAGHAMAGHAQVILDQAERLRADMAEHAAGLQGRVRLLANTAALVDFLPEALAAFLADHPGLDVDIEERSSLAIVAALRDGSAELGIISDAVEADGLACLPLRRDRLVAVLPPAHRLAGRASLRFAELADEDFVGLGPGSALQDYLAHQAARLGKSLSLRVRLKSFDAVCRMIERGVGVAIVPAAAIAAGQAVVVAASLDDAWADRRLALCVRDAAALPPVARRLFDHLAATARP